MPTLDNINCLRGLDQTAIKKALSQSGLGLQIGPFNARVRSRHASTSDDFITLYSDFPAELEPQFSHFHIEVDSRRSPLSLSRPQARFVSDGFEPFKPMPATQALPLFEWGLNWSIATQAPNFLVVHAAVIARHDQAIVMPGIPGAGKSTLCAALVAAGWRLLSDEFALISPDTLQVHPIPRPISLKNASIDIIRNRWPDAWNSPPVKDTIKGTVSLFRPPRSSVDAMAQTAHVRWIVFPRYTRDHGLEFVEIGRARAIAALIEHVVNFTELPRRHFIVLNRLFAHSRAANLEYSDLDDAISHLTQLVETSS